MEGLDAEVAGRGRSASVYYERAIQLDPNNPYVYLAMARHELEGGAPTRALEHLDRAEQLLDAERARSPRVEAHLLGLRGAALRASGSDGGAYLSEAARLAPEVWGDAELSAAELR